MKLVWNINNLNNRTRKYFYNGYVIHFSVNSRNPFQLVGALKLCSFIKAVKVEIGPSLGFNTFAFSNHIWASFQSPNKYP